MHKQYKIQSVIKQTALCETKKGALTETVFHLLFSLLFAQLDSFLLSSSTHLLRIQCFVLVALHPVVIFSRTCHCV